MSKMQYLLKMHSKLELYSFLYKMDQIYNCNEKINEYKARVDNIKEFARIKSKGKEIGLPSDLKVNEKQKKDYKRSLPQGKIEKEEYSYFLKEKNIKDSDSSIIAFYKELIKFYKKSIKQLSYECDVTIYEHFFKEDLKNLINSTNISKDEMEKYLKLYSLMFPNINNEYTDKFRNEINRLSVKYVYLICKEMSEEYQNKNLTASDFINMLDKVNFSDLDNALASVLQEQAEKEIIHNFSNLISKKYGKKINSMTKFLMKQGRFNELGNYSLKVVRIRKWRKKSNIL